MKHASEITSATLRVNNQEFSDILSNAFSGRPHQSQQPSFMALSSQEILGGSLRALKKWGETLDYVLCFFLYFFHALAASCVLYNGTKRSQGFFIC